jgi:hypothetical protein
MRVDTTNWLTHSLPPWQCSGRIYSRTHQQKAEREREREKERERERERENNQKFIFNFRVRARIKYRHTHTLFPLCVCVCVCVCVWRCLWETYTVYIHTHTTVVCRRTYTTSSIGQQKKEGNVTGNKIKGNKESRGVCVYKRRLQCGMREGKSFGLFYISFSKAKYTA